jgi:hypothetical protein
VISCFGCYQASQRMELLLKYFTRCVCIIKITQSTQRGINEFLFVFSEQPLSLKKLSFIWLRAFVSLKNSTSYVLRDCINDAAIRYVDIETRHHLNKTGTVW